MEPIWNPFGRENTGVPNSRVSNSIAIWNIWFVVYDWTMLGLFTGSHVPKYAQTRLKAGIRYNTIPITVDAGI
jgi:hypothetical protein